MSDPQDRWVYEEQGSPPGTFGYLDATGAFVDRPNLIEVPQYMASAECALSFKMKVLASGRRLFIEEIEDDMIGQWRATILDGAGRPLAEGLTDRCGQAIIAAVLDDLINNEGASWWLYVQK